MSNMKGAIPDVTPHENAGRLDRASDVIAEMNIRVQTAVSEVAEVKMQISDLSSQMAGQVPELGGYHEEMAAIELHFAGLWTAAKDDRLLLVTLKADEQAVSEQLALIDGNMMLEIGFELGEDKKPKFKNDKSRAAENARRLATDEQYVAAKSTLRTATIATGECKARLESFGDVMKEYGRRNASLVSRLDNTTAQLNSINGGAK